MPAILKGPPKHIPFLEMNREAFPDKIYFGQENFPVLLAKETLKQTNEFMIEYWAPESYADKIYSLELEGILHKKFPSEKMKWGMYFYGDGPAERSQAMVEQLNTEIEAGNVLVHLHGLHTSSINYILHKAKLDRVPVVITQRGAGTPEMIVKQRPSYLPKYLVEKLVSRKIDYYILQSRVEYEFRKQKYGGKGIVHIQDGLDFDQFSHLQKKEARRKLGLPTEGSLLLYVGSFFRGKGVDLLIEAYENLKNLQDDMQLVLVGGYKNDELYDMVVKSGAIFHERLPKEKLNEFYAAANVYILVSHNDYLVTWGGIGNANIEALACGTPIYSSQLMHFMGSEEEKKALGLQYTRDSDITQDILTMIEHADQYTRTREIARKYYDREANVAKIVTIYKELFKTYFGERYHET